MAGISGMLTAAVAGLMSAPGDGMTVRAAAIRAAAGGAPLVPIRQITQQNVGVETSDKSGLAKYPAALVYCDKLGNKLREKFRQFSGTASMVVEIRYSLDRLDNIETELQVYVDAVCALLDDHRGDWGDGAFYTGGYEVSYEAATKGGKNFLQRAKVKFDVEVSK